jgi:hypothetical protein
MRNGIAALVALAGAAVLAGCDGSAASPSRQDSSTTNGFAAVRHQVDAPRQRVWWLTRDGVYVQSASKSERIAVPLPGWTWAEPPYGCLPDLALGPKGEAIITSNVVSTVWRVDAETLAVSTHPLALDTDLDKDVGFSALVYSPEHESFFGVSGHHGSLWKIDPLLTKAEKIKLSIPVRSACGVAVAANLATLDSGRMHGLCVRGPRREWTVDLVLAHRAGYVRGKPCIALNGK